MATYKFGRVIGEGGFSEVIEAVRKSDGKMFAAKRLKPESDYEDIRRFKREVRIMKKLRHPNIVPLVGKNISDDLPWYVMPKALMDLEHFLGDTYGERCLWIFEEVLDAISYAHAKGIIHRDIKPSNVLIYENSHQKFHAQVSDFGIGRLVNRDTTILTQTDLSMGTDLYMAPEQRTNAKDVDARADIFSLGLILYEILTGESPRQPLDFNHRYLPRRFVPVIQKATQLGVDDRYQTIEEMKQDLEASDIDDESFLSMADSIKDTIEEIQSSENYNTDKVSDLVRRIHANADDDDVLQEVFPRIRGDLLESLIVQDFSTFSLVLQTYDAEVASASGDLPFAYCDVVANFYKEVFQLTEDYETRALILRRLPYLGYSHNRYYVPKVFGRLIAGLDDPALVIVVRDVLRNDPPMAEWCKKESDNASEWPAVIIRAIQ